MLALSLLVFALPLYHKAIPIIVAVSLVLVAFSSSWNEKVRLFKERKRSILLFSSFYVIHLLGMIWSTNQSFGWFDMEIKLSLLLFPLILMTSNVINPQNLYKFLWSFMIGCLVAVFVCYGYATWRYFTEVPNPDEDVNYFFYGEFSIFHHAGYFSMYLNVAVGVLINFIFDQKNKVKINHFVILAIFIVTIFQLAARSGIISLCLLIVYTFIYLIFPRFKWFNSFIGFVVTVGIASLIIYNYNPVLLRFQKAKDALLEQQEDLQESSAGIRRGIWLAAMPHIQDNWLLGVGTGDVKDVLVSSYEAKGIKKAYLSRLNAHNQYIQTALALGLVGLTILLANLVIPFVRAFKHGSFLYCMFLFVVAFNFITESALETQAGVVFFAMMNTTFALGTPVDRLANKERESLV